LFVKIIKVFIFFTESFTLEEPMEVLVWKYHVTTFSLKLSGLTKKISVRLAAGNVANFSHIQLLQNVKEISEQILQNICPKQVQTDAKNGLIR
jgi:hypothetical protein